MTEPVVRVSLLEQQLPVTIVGGVQVRRITLQPNVAGGPHHHNGAVFGAVESGSVHVQIEGGPSTVLRAGDVFYEPAGVLIDRFDATSEGVTFLGYFLVGPGEAPELTPGPPPIEPEDPYGLPRFAGEHELTGWADHSEIALRTVRVFTSGPLTATVIAHPGVWDLILSDGRGGVRFLTLDPAEIAPTLLALGSTPS
jgi:quercetin dioxygenase-like cupin family protein